jgi:hypothetical protein
MANRKLLFWTAMAWLLFAACALWLTRAGLQLDTDSAMRLAQVRDLLQGQNWFDTVQHRMNTPYGLPMHWSRLADAPIALLTLGGQSLALNLWPLLLFGCVLFLLARLAARLGGEAAGIVVLLLALLCTEIHGTFAPGNIDHHGLQLALMLTALTGVVERRPRLTAVAVALGLGVGLESLPYAVVAIGLSVFDRDNQRAFGLTILTAALVLLLATTADPYRLTPACDTYSPFYAVLLMAGGAGAAAISFLPRHRLAALGLLALALLGLAALLNPACLAGPYAGLDPRMRTLFFARINEAHPVWDFIKLAPSETAGGYLYAAFALVLCFFAPPGRPRLAVILFAAMALLVATFQFRAAPFALLFALPGLAAALVRLTQKRALRAVWLAAAIILGNGAAFTLAGAFAEGEDHVAARAMAFKAQEDCGHAPSLAVLQALPPGRVAAFVDQGPGILAYTPDSAIAGPYHRDAAGILDSYAIFTGPDPRAILKRRGIDYLMTCRAAPDWDFYRAKGGLVAQLAKGDVPDWLMPAGRSGDVEVYRVAH